MENKHFYRYSENVKIWGCIWYCSCKIIKKFNAFAASDKKVFALHNISMSEILQRITKRYQQLHNHLLSKKLHLLLQFCTHIIVSKTVKLCIQLHLRFSRMQKFWKCRTLQVLIASLDGRHLTIFLPKLQMKITSYEHVWILRILTTLIQNFLSNEYIQRQA
jgi:hypothetical protein